MADSGRWTWGRLGWTPPSKKGGQNVDRIKLRKASPLERWDAKPLTWWPARKPQTGAVTAVCACANGHVVSLMEHTIAPTGEVEPSVACAQDDCSWNGRVLLDGWP